MPERNRCYDIINRLATRHSWPVQKWSYDGQKNLWTAVEFLPPGATTFSVEVVESGAGPAAVRVSTTFQVGYCHGAMPSGNTLHLLLKCNLPIYLVTVLVFTQVGNDHMCGAVACKGGAGNQVKG